MKEVWQEQLDDYLFQVADMAEDWPELIERIEQLPEDKRLHEYLSLLVPRLKHMQRKMNRVYFDSKSRCFSVANYTYEMYFSLKQKYPGKLTITPYTLSIHTDDLTDSDRDQLHKQLTSSL